MNIPTPATRLVALTTLLAAAACAPAAGPSRPATAPAPVATRYFPPERDDAAVARSPSYRVEGDVVPKGYTASLLVVPTSDVVDGRITIALDVVRPTSTVWLNAEGLTFSRVAMTVGTTAFAGAAAGRLVQGKPGFIGVSFPEALPLGPATLTLEYRAELPRDGSKGAFRRKYDGDDYVFTQFEAIAARRVFPCFDEPTFKVPWTLALDVPRSTAAFSNTPPLHTTAVGGDRKHVEFATTKPLPSYLVAFAVGPFAIRDAGAARSGARVRVVAPRNAAGKTSLVAANAAAIVTDLETYFDIPYAYEKLDLVVVPDLNLAMEHPGLVTMGFHVAFADVANRYEARHALNVLSHELAHQWFGDLVTVRSWDDLWLNEGFATWMADKLDTLERPTFHTTGNLTAETTDAMDADAEATGRAVRAPLSTLETIDPAFDEIAYAKGAALLHMVEASLGDDVVQSAVRAYLRAHAHGSVTSDDFLHALDVAAGKNVSTGFATFLDQRGVPEVDVELACAANGTQLRLAVAPYGVDTKGPALPSEGPKAAAAHWQFPLCIRFGRDGHDDGRACTTLETGAVLELPYCPTWLVPNAGGDAYAHVHADAAAVLAAVPHANAAERVAMLRDVRASAFAGREDLGTWLTLARAYAGDESPLVVALAARAIADVREMGLMAPWLAPTYERFVRDTFGARARTLGFVAREGEEPDAPRLREILVPFAATFGQEPDLSSEARARTTLDLNHLKKGALDAPWFARTITAAHGDRTTLASFERARRAAAKPAVRHALLYALGRLRDPNALADALELSLSKDVDRGETLTVLASASQSVEGRDAAAAYVRAHYDALRERVSPREQTELVDLGIARCDAAGRDVVAAFFAPRVVDMPNASEARRRLDARLAQLDDCARWKRAQLANGTRFFESYNVRARATSSSSRR